LFYFEEGHQYQLEFESAIDHAVEIFGDIALAKGKFLIGSLDAFGWTEIVPTFT
jgi:hypothetical protein